jgi:DNA-binding transcriptional MerR regulator
MKYLTTLEVAHQLKVSKQTLLNWLYAGKVPEPPRNRQGYRLWSPGRVSLVLRMIDDGRLHKRTVVHRQPSNRPDLIVEYAREVQQFLRDGGIELRAFVRELTRVHRARPRHSQGTSGMKRRSTGRPSRK